MQVDTHPRTQPWPGQADPGPGAAREARAPERPGAGPPGSTGAVHGGGGPGPGQYSTYTRDSVAG